MPAVSNSSPLIALAEIARLDVLRGLFGSIVIPPSVAAEVSPSVPFLPEWIQVQPLAKPFPAALVRRSLGPGEREAIALALEARPRRIILDDLPARRIATALGLPIIGTLGVLLAAKQAGLVDAVRPLIHELAKGGFFVSDDLYRDLLQAAGELTE